MEKDHSNDIKTGEDKWIAFVDHSDRDPSLDVDIDPYISDLKELWDTLETECVAGCCGIEAFNFTPENVARAKASLDDQVILNRLYILRQKLITMDGDVVSSDRLNHHSFKQSFLALIDHLIDCFGIGANY